MNINQNTMGIVLLLLISILAFVSLPNTILFFRFLIGIGFGFALVKASLGFAASVNRLSRYGNSSTAKALMFMFVLTAIFTSFVIYGNESSYKLNIYPINIGLLLGGLLFGFGMALSSCCATGALTDLASGFSKASVTIFFFTIGVFFGFSYQSSASWIKESWISSATGEKSKGGVFLPDLFSNFDGVYAYLGAIGLTVLFASIVILVAHSYEKKLGIKNNNTKIDKKSVKNFLKDPWNMRTSTIIIAILFTTLLLISHKGWSATSTFGLWFAKLLMIFGISAKSISEFTLRPVEFFTQSLLGYSTSVQNFGIIFGAVLALLMANTFNKSFIAGLAITPLAFVVYSFGGFMMGFGTRLSNGCNVGALYTPIVEFSLSGWIYLIVVAIGGFTGNWFIKKYISQSCKF